MARPHPELFVARLTDEGLRRLCNTNRKGGPERFIKVAGRLGVAYRTASYTYVKWSDCASFTAYAHQFIEEINP